MSIFGDSAPVVVDSGNPSSILLGVRVFSDVAGQVLGCRFYKAPTNTGPHVVSLWDSTGKLLATQAASSETASGMQSIGFSVPVPIVAKQTYTCGYFAPHGHYSNDRNFFTTQKDVPPLHVPVNGGVYLYGTQATTFPTTVYLASNYWVDVMFLPSTGLATTWISGTQAAVVGSTASVTWNTVVPSNSQVEYGPTTSYGNTSALAPALTSSHSIAIGGLPAGITHYRVRSGDSDLVLASGADHVLTTVAAALPVSVSLSPLNSTLASGATQQFVAAVTNTTNPAVTWAATSGTINAGGLFTAANVSSQTSVTVSAVSVADTSKSAFATLTVKPAVPALAVSTTSLTFSGMTGTSNPAPASVNLTNTGGGSLTFTGVSDQAWLLLSTPSGAVPSTLQIAPSITGLKAGTYTGHVSLTAGGVTKTVTAALTLTAPPVQHSVALSWKASTNSHVVSYSMYRSAISGSSYALAASAVGGVSYMDQSVQSGTTYYYVVTAVDDQGRESIYSNEIRVAIP